MILSVLIASSQVLLFLHDTHDTIHLQPRCHEVLCCRLRVYPSSCSNKCRWTEIRVLALAHPSNSAHVPPSVFGTFVTSTDDGQTVQHQYEDDSDCEIVQSFCMSSTMRSQQRSSTKIDAHGEIADFQSLSALSDRFPKMKSCLMGL